MIRLPARPAASSRASRMMLWLLLGLVAALFLFPSLHHLFSHHAHDAGGDDCPLCLAGSTLLLALTAVLSLLFVPDAGSRLRDTMASPLHDRQRPFLPSRAPPFAS